MRLRALILGVAALPALVAASPIAREADLGAAYAGFARRAAAEPEAAYYQAQVLHFCMPFAGVALTRNQGRAGEPGPGNARRAALDTLEARCRGVPVETTRVESASLLRDAMRRGEPKSRALDVGFSPIGVGEKSSEDTATVRSMVLSKDPEVIENLKGYYYRRHRVLAWTIPGVEGMVSGNEMGHALTLAACDLGAACGADSLESLVMCALRGVCGDREAQYRAINPAGSWPRIEAARRALHAAYASGQWPPGFFSGGPPTSPVKASPVRAAPAPPSSAATVPTPSRG